MDAAQHPLFATDEIVFIAILHGNQAAMNDDGTIRLFATRADAEAAKGPLGTSAAVRRCNLHKALYGAKMPKGE